MSYANLGPIPMGSRNGDGLLRGATLFDMGRSVAIIVCAGLLAAIYHMALEETRSFAHNIRLRAQYRRSRHDALLVALLGSPIEAHLQHELLESSDAFKTSMNMLADPLVATGNKAYLREAIREAMGSQE